MELTMRYVVAIALGLVVVATLIILIGNTALPVNKTNNYSMLFNKGCGILARNGCDMNITVEGVEFKEIIQQLGYSEESVKRRCCIDIG